MELHTLGILVFSILSILVIIKNLYIKIYDYSFLWFCEFAPFLFLIGFLINDNNLINALINIGFLPQLLISVLLIQGMVSNVDLIEAKSYIKNGKFHTLFMLIIHIIPVNLALLLTYHQTPDHLSLVYTFIIITLMFAATLIIAPKKENINLVYYVNVSDKNKTKKIKLPFHTPLWIPYTFILAWITYLMLIAIR